MPRVGGKLKIQWIVENTTRNTTFRKRRATLLEKAKELSILCKTPVAMVVYGPGNSEPAFYPPELDEARGIMRKYLELPEASKEAHRLDNEGFLRKLLKKLGKRFETYKASARQLEINLILNDISLGRRRSLDDLAPELAAAVRAEVELLRSSVYERMNKLTSGAAAVVPPPLTPEEAAAAALVSSQQEPLMVMPLAMAPPNVWVTNAPLFVQPPPLEPDLLLVPQQQPLMAPPQEPPMVLPFAMAPPMVADVPKLVPVPQGDPLAPAAGVGVDDDGFPRGGSYLLEVADAILDDGSGDAVQATDEDVERLLREHGLESFIKPKPPM